MSWSLSMLHAEIREQGLAPVTEGGDDALRQSE
jgi:hypothetical protein